MAPTSTRERILDAAEELVAEHGIADTSLRALTRHAGVNLAAVHYHFGSRDGLLDALVERLAEPINRDRREALERLERAGEGWPDAPAILCAFFHPVVALLLADDHHGRHDRLARLLARIESEPPGEVARLSRRHFGEVARLYVDALVEALPTLDRDVVAERFRLANAVFTAAFTGQPAPGCSARVRPRHRDAVGQARDAIAFAIAGLCAPGSSSSPLLARSPSVPDSGPDGHVCEVAPR